MQTRPAQPPMPELVVASRRELAAPAGLAAAEREMWRDEDGLVFAYGQRFNGVHWLDVPGVGLFRFSDLDTPILVAPEPSASGAAVAEAYRRLVLPNAFQALGHEVLHGSAVFGRDGIVALCARSRTGKSTLAFGLSRRGYPLWADDAVAFDVVGDRVRALPLPFTIQLRAASASFFGYAAATEPSPAAQRGKPAELEVVFLLERAAGDATEVQIRRLTQQEAFVALLANAYWFTLADKERKRRMLGQYLDLTSLVPVFRLCFPPAFERLDATLDELERTLATEVRG